METREILIANTKTQTRSKITTNATTLRELKAALDAEGIDYNGMTFTEGISKTQLLNDDTQLPQNVMFKGQPTNNLVILLTNTKKNIASGIIAADRKACYNIIKEHDLQSAVKEKFGRNFTQVPTLDLQKFIEDNTTDKKPTYTEMKNTEKVVTDETTMPDPEKDNLPMHVSDIITDMDINTPEDSLYIHIATLTNTNILSISDLEELRKDIDYLIRVAKKEQNTSDKEGVAKTPVSTYNGGITEGDINTMLNGLI